MTRRSTLLKLVRLCAAANHARVNVPDERFLWLCEAYKPKSEVPAFLEVVDIAGLVRCGPVRRPGSLSERSSVSLGRLHGVHRSCLPSAARRRRYESSHRSLIERKRVCKPATSAHLAHLLVAGRMHVRERRPPRPLCSAGCQQTLCTCSEMPCWQGKHAAPVRHFRHTLSSLRRTLPAQGSVVRGGAGQRLSVKHLGGGRHLPCVPCL